MENKKKLFRNPVLNGPKFEAGCIPTYKPKPHKKFSDWDAEMNYEPDGPFFGLHTHEGEHSLQNSSKGISKTPRGYKKAPQGCSEASQMKFHLVSL